MGSIETAVGDLINAVSASMRRFTSFLFILFMLGMLVGARIIQSNASLFPTAVIIPAFLAIVSYYYTEAAVVFFVIFALVFLVL